MHVFLQKKHIWGGLPYLWVLLPFETILLVVLVSFGALGHKSAKLSMGRHQKLHSMLQKWMKSNADVASCLYSKKIIFLVLQYLAGSYNVSEIKMTPASKMISPKFANQKDKKGKKCFSNWVRMFIHSQEQLTRQCRLKVHLVAVLKVLIISQDLCQQIG